MSLVCLVAGLVVALVLALSGGGRAPLLVPRQSPPGGDPLAFSGSQEHDLEKAAAEGLSHVLYAKSPGGVLATATRTARFRELIERAAAGSATDPDLLEALVFLESSGRPDVIAGSDPVRAAGLTQILAETAQNFLGLHVDLPASRRLTRAITDAVRRGDNKRAEQLRAERRRVDARFDPAQALAATVRYLSTARERYGRNDLALVSYHMGIGNLERVLRDYVGTASTTPIRELVATNDLSWARIYFDASPARHRLVWQRLTTLGDDSQSYYWRLLAAKAIMRLYRDDRSKLEQLAALQTAKASAEDVLHPPDTTERFHTPTDLEQASKKRTLEPLPNQPAKLHYRIDPQMGELARRLGRKPDVYRRLRPEALALLLYLANRVNSLSNAPTPLTVTSTVRDDTYQKLLLKNNPEATPNYSLHTTGYTFDILRKYGSPAQASAFQYELERLQARNLIAWVREPRAIHITVSTDARALMPTMLHTSTS